MLIGFGTHHSFSFSKGTPASLLVSLLLDMTDQKFSSFSFSVLLLHDSHIFPLLSFSVVLSSLLLEQLFALCILPTCDPLMKDINVEFKKLQSCNVLKGLTAGKEIFTQHNSLDEHLVRCMWNN